MRNEKILFIGGSVMLNGLNHRPKYMASYIERRFKHFDAVGFEKCYDGPPTASAWSKARQSISDLLHRRVKISARDSARLIVIRDLFAPPPLNMVFQDLWRYVNLCRVISPPYDLAIFAEVENAWLARLLKRSGRVNRVIYDDWDYQPGLARDVITKQLMEYRELMCVRDADAVIPVNALLGRRRIEQGARQVVVVPNGVDLPLFSQAITKTPHPPTLVYLGSLSKLWGIDLAIRAMPKLLEHIPNIRFLIAGEGPEEDALQALSQELGVTESVRFLGRMEQRDLPAVLAEADIGVGTSRPDSKFRKYASPLKLIEYMAAGLPVIATGIGHMETMMQESQAGFMIDHSVEDFVQAALNLLNDKATYKRYAQAAVAYAAGFDWDLLMERVYQCSLHVLADNRAPDALPVSPESPQNIPLMKAR